MPITLHKYFGDDYYECETRKFLPGDEVIHNSWLRFNDGYKSVYKIVSIDIWADTITAYDPFRERYDMTWPIQSNFGPTGWLCKLTEQPYDPTQQGDTDEDI